MFICTVGCETGRPKYAEAPLSGKFRVSILYPNGEGKTFDFEYYEKKHMPMVASFLGENLIHYETEKGVMGRTSGEEPPFLAIGYFYINNINIRKVMHNDAKRTKNEN